MIRVMENPVLLITESRDQEIDRQLAKSISAGAVVQQSRGTPIIEELWHGTIAPSELAKAEVVEDDEKPEEKFKAVDNKQVSKSVLDALDALTKSDDKDEDDVGGEDPAKEEMDDKAGVEDDKKDKKGEASESVKSEIEFFINLVKADEETEDSQMTDAEAEGAADREANKDDSEDEGDSEKSVSSALDDLIKAGKTGEGSRGGHIIGHTKSGKPIYENSHTHRSFEDSQSHKDAAEAHKKAEGDATKKLQGWEDDYQKRKATHKQRSEDSMTDNSGAHRQVVGPEPTRNPIMDSLEQKKQHHVKMQEFHNMKAKNASAADSFENKMLGHTSSGKPIHNGLEHPAHKDFTPQDHVDAAAHHLHAADHPAVFHSNPMTMSKDDRQALGEHHENEAEKHFAASGYQRKTRNSQLEAHKGHIIEHGYGEYTGGPSFHVHVSGPNVNQSKAYSDPSAPIKGIGEAREKIDQAVKSMPTEDLSKGTPMGVPEIKVDQYGIPLYEGVAFEVHDDADKNTVRELIDAGLVGDPEHTMDKRIPQLVSRLGMIY